MSLVLRRSKGSKLSSAEMDDNLLWLSQTLSGSDGTGVIQVTGSSLNASNTPITSSFFTGDGSALTNVTASYLPGIDGRRLLNVTASYISPSIVIPVRGTDTQIQFNSGSALSGSNRLIYKYDSQSLAHGNNNHDTIGLYSHAEGNDNTTIGEYSHAEGSSNYTGIYGYVVDSTLFNDPNTEVTLDSSYGNVTSQFNSGYLLVKEGTGASTVFYKYSDYTGIYNGFNTIIIIPNVDVSTTVTTDDVVILSNSSGTSLQFKPLNADTLVTSDYSHVEGVGSYTLNYSSHAEGWRSIAAGAYSHTEGREATAIGLASHAEGYQTLATGGFSHAEGSNTIASGQASHAEGWNTIASGRYQLAIGQYNESLPSQSAFIVGDGTSEINRHNVLFVSKSHFEVNASNMYLQGLVNSSQTYVVAIDTATGKLSYTLASGVGSLTPAGGNNTAIQFNSSSKFSGSNNFTYNYTASIVTLTGSMFVSGAISASFGSNTVGFFGTSSWAASASRALTASFVVTASYVTGSIFTSINPALTASHALTASFVRTAQTASYVTGSIFTSTNRALTASYALTSSQSTTASYALFALNGGSSTTPQGDPGEIQYNEAGAFNGVPTLTYDGTTLRATGSFTGSLIGSLFGTASWAESASQALTASFVTTVQTASYVTGSVFTSTNQALTASHALTASFVTTAQTASYITGSVFTSTNLVLSASNALTASYVTGSTFTSTNLALSASNALTASYVSGSIFTSTNRVLSSSYALTASYVPSIRAGSASIASFISAGGGDYIADVIFSTAFPNNNYAVTVTGEDARSWTIQSKQTTQFTINSNSTTVLTGPVYWIAMPFNS